LFESENNPMRFFLLVLLAIPVFTMAQVDTVVVRSDAQFVSKFSHRLNYARQNLKYHMEERGNVREVFVFFSTLEDLRSGEKMYAVRVDPRGNRNIFTDAPLESVEYIDADELPQVIGYLDKILNEIIPSDHNGARYTEFRFYTRGGVMLECYTGLNRWRFCINYKIGNMGLTNLQAYDKGAEYTYINNPSALRELRDIFAGIQKEIPKNAPHPRP
jgi:hypothetical protein